MFDLAGIDIEELATALADQTDYEHRCLLDPRTGQVAAWTSDTGIDGENPVEIEELDFIPIDPIPSYVWYQDMTDFASGISDDAAGRRLARALQGRGAFGRFKNQLYEHHPELISAWHALRDIRAQRRAVEWLLDTGLIDDDAAEKFAADHPDPPCPDAGRHANERPQSASLPLPAARRFPDMPAVSRGRRNTSLIRLCRGGRCGSWRLRAVDAGGDRPGVAAVAGRAGGEADRTGARLMHRHGAGVSVAVRRDQT